MLRKGRNDEQEVLTLKIIGKKNINLTAMSEGLKCTLASDTIQKVSEGISKIANEAGDKLSAGTVEFYGSVTQIGYNKIMQIAGRLSLLKSSIIEDMNKYMENLIKHNLKEVFNRLAGVYFSIINNDGKDEDFPIIIMNMMAGIHELVMDKLHLLDRIESGCYGKDSSADELPAVITLITYKVEKTEDSDTVNQTEDSASTTNNSSAK